MKIDILTLFPEMFEPLNKSIIGRACKDERIEIDIINIRDFSKDRHKKCDDAPFGGGAGMVMTPQPLFDAIKSVRKEKSITIFTSPRGEVLNQNLVQELSKEEHLIILCGHYEGVDQRVIDLCVDKEISIGDYVLTGGELPAMVIADAVARYVPEVLNKNSLFEESFSNLLLEYPQYTRPQEFQGLRVPEVLISGNHKKVDQWRLEQSIKITKERRKDLYKKFLRSQNNI